MECIVCIPFLYVREDVEFVEELIDDFARYIQASPCNFIAIDNQVQLLKNAGYVQLLESDSWNLEFSGKYYATRNGSSLVAFRVPEEMPKSFSLVASHSDSPTFRIKPNPEIKTGKCTTLNVEMYGGALMGSWFDRPLSVAGRIAVAHNGRISLKNVVVDNDLLVIPSLAIHMNREANKGYTYNVQKDLLPLFGDGAEASLLSLIAKAAGVDESEILSHELVLYNRMAPARIGDSGQFFSAPRLDDLLCAYASLCGFLGSDGVDTDAMAVHVVYDNEEVGSGTKQGAASTFLKDVLKRAVQSLGGDKEQFKRMIAQSFMLSADNAHAFHPNYPEKSDPVNRPIMGGGVVLKHAANQHYTTDALSSALCAELASKVHVDLQDFSNRSDSPGGSTLGNISSLQLPVITADVGVAQLAMHSSYETCAVKDVIDLVSLTRQLFSSCVEELGVGEYRIM